MYAQIDRAAAQWQTQAGSKDERLDNIADGLDVDIQADKHDDGLELSYEVWEDDVGISVILSYSISEDEFTIIKYKAMQEKR